jgi:AcrR family transcriptional regulator
MTAVEEARRGPGRPRSPQAHEAILDATVDLLAEVGYAGLTMEGIACRAGVGKATIYRRWPSKVALVVEAVQSTTEPVPDPDTGSVRGDFEILTAKMVDKMTRSSAGRIMVGLVADAARNPELAEALRSGFIAGRRAALKVTLERGVGRGEVRPDVDVDLVGDLLVGPLYYRLMVSGGPVDEQFADQVVDAVLRVVAP